MTTRQTQAIMRKSLITIGLAAASLAAIAGLTACGSSAPVGQAAPKLPATSAPAAGAVNPVTIVKQAGATPPAGAVNGDHDIQGDRMADGEYLGGESMTVYSSQDQAAYQDQLTRNGQPDDGTAIITIPSKLTVVFVNAAAVDGPDGQMTNKWTVTPATIAQRVGGTAVPAS
jgi:hypothetical protein